MIEFLGVHKAFGAKRVLEGLSLRVPDGQTTALIGFSGTGKSVALKHVVGLLTADRGTVQVEGRDVAALSHEDLDLVRGQIGYVFQFAALFDSMSVGDNIRMGLRRRGIDGHEIEDRVRHSLGVVDLGGTEGPLPGGAVGRHAQTGGHRAGHRDPSEVHPVRRAHHRARSGDERRHRPA